jgi:hypothetical protein
MDRMADRKNIPGKDAAFNAYFDSYCGGNGSTIILYGFKPLKKLQKEFEININDAKKITSDHQKEIQWQKEIRESVLAPMIKFYLVECLVDYGSLQGLCCIGG